MTFMSDLLRHKVTEPADQVAALPLRREDDGGLRVLMVTSRDTGRWVMPKGWTEQGMTYAQAASLEALEEAGAVGPIAEQALGEFRYLKRLEDGKFVECRVHLFPMLVEKLNPDWKERDQRSRRWFTLPESADAVDEPELSALLRGLSEDPAKQSAIHDLLKAS